MGEVLTIRLCSRCSVLYRKNPDNYSDYNEDGKLQSYCPMCGYMHPPVSINNEEKTLSKRKRKKIAVRIAMKYDLPFEEVKSMVTELNDLSIPDFIQIFMEKIDRGFGINLQDLEV